MPAHAPEEVARLWAESLTAGDLSALVELYEADATLVPQPGEVVTGIEAIREALSALLATEPTFYLKEDLTYRGHRALFCRLDPFRDRT